MLWRRVLATLDFVAVCFNSAHGLAPDVAVLLYKLGQESAGRKVARHVGLDEHLAGAASSSSNANGGDGQLLGDDGGYFLRHSFEDHGVAASFLDGEGVLKDAHCAVARLALDAEATEGVLSLGSQANVCEDGDAGCGDFLDCGCHFLAALELDGLDAAFFDEADGGG